MSDGKLTAAPLIKARGVSSSNQNKVQNGGGTEKSTSITPTPTTTARFQNSATENYLCLRENGKCTRQRLDGQKYCLQHMKPDKDSNYRQCNYVSSRNGKRCFNVTIKSETGTEGFCTNHARLVTFYRRRTAHRNRFHDTADTLLENINRSLMYKGSKSDHKSISNQPRLDYYSESSDDEAKETVMDTKSAFEDSDMELEEYNDPLKHAGIFTAEEIVRMTLEKMTTLRELYGEQLKVLNRKYKMKRQKYLRLIKVEGEAQGPLSVLVRTYAERKKMGQLRALRRYSKHFGKEALLHKQMKDRQRKTNGSQISSRSENSNVEKKSCSFFRNETKCCSEPLPSSSYCLNHILHDERQIIFKKCQKNDCSTPVCQCLPFDRCWLHRPIVNVSSDDLVLPFKFDVEKSKINIQNEREKLTTNQKVVAKDDLNLPFKQMDVEKPNVSIEKDSEKLKTTQEVDISFLHNLPSAQSATPTKYNEDPPASSGTPFKFDGENSKLNLQKEREKLKSKQKVVATVIKDDSNLLSKQLNVEKPNVTMEKDTEKFKTTQKNAFNLSDSLDAPPSLVSSKYNDELSASYRTPFKFDVVKSKINTQKEWKKPQPNQGSVKDDKNTEKFKTTQIIGGYSGNLAAPSLVSAKYNDDLPATSRTPKPSPVVNRSSNSEEHSYGRW